MSRFASTMLIVAALIALLFHGAIFGFFFAWVCSTMWGLDMAEPTVAVAAMQAMNASVRNAVFFPAFFLTPVVGLLVAVLAWSFGRKAAAMAFAAAAVLYAAGGIVPTAMVNVPMNEALAAQGVVADPARAAELWAAYSPRWQVWNMARTVASGAALLLAGWGAAHVRHRYG